MALLKVLIVASAAVGVGCQQVRSVDHEPLSLEPELMTCEGVEYGDTVALRCPDGTIRTQRNGVEHVIPADVVRELVGLHV